MDSTRYSCHILMKLEISRQIFDKCSDFKFNKNLSSGSLTQTDMTTATVACRKIVNAPKNGQLHQNMSAVTNAKGRQWFRAKPWQVTVDNVTR